MRPRRPALRAAEGPASPNSSDDTNDKVRTRPRVDGCRAAVVDDDDLQRRCTFLPFEDAEARLEQVRASAGRDDDADRRHGHGVMNTSTAVPPFEGERKRCAAIREVGELFGIPSHDTRRRRRRAPSRRTSHGGFGVCSLEPGCAADHDLDHVARRDLNSTQRARRERRRRSRRSTSTASSRRRTECWTQPRTVSSSSSRCLARSRWCTARSRSALPPTARGVLPRRNDLGVHREPSSTPYPMVPCPPLRRLLRAVTTSRRKR